MSGYTIEKPSTELMQNYLRGEIMDPTQPRFEAVESSAGNTLLFSIGTDGVLYVTAELPGDSDSHTGWQQFNLSAGTNPPGFSAGGAQCGTFDVARCPDGTLRLAMVLNDKNNANASDALYLGTIQPNTEKVWFKSPKWTQYPYDDQTNARSPVKIVNVFLSEATDGDYTVVDVRDTPSRPQNIFRYYIDQVGHPAWQPHALPVSVQADKYSSCLGRKADADVDGIYTSGHEGGAAQIVYTPLLGRRGHVPLSDSLHLPGNLVPDAISACRNPSDNSSDLYAAAGGRLYYFASGNQHDGAQGRVVSNNSLFNNVDQLFASRSSDSAVVWGLNANKQIFYVTCPPNKLTDLGSWSVPLPIMSGVQQVSPFVNQGDSANTFFAHTAGNELKIAKKKMDAKAQASRAWTVRDVHLPLPDAKKKQKTPAQKFRSYTTHIKVTGPDKRPAAGKKVSITAPRGVTSLYINHLYYPVGATPIQVPTDAAGSVTIIEPISRLDGTQLQVALADDAGTATDIKPMQDAPTVSERLKTLRTPDGLVNATIRYQNEKKNPPRKLLLKAKQNASDPDVKNAADNIDNLWNAHDHLTGKTLTGVPSSLASAQDDDRYKNFVGGKTPIKVDAGDLMLMLESHRATRARAGLLGGGESFWDFLVGLFEGVWQFIVKIGEAIFAFVIEVVEDVFAAFKYVFDKIVELIEDVIDFVMFLFELEDIQRTKDVIQNLTNVFLKDQIAYLATVRTNFDTWVASIIKEIDDWAKPKTLALASQNKTINQLQSSSQLAQASASDSHLSYHFSDNVADAMGDSGAATLPDGSSPLLIKLANQLQNELDTLATAAKQLSDLTTHFGDMNPEDAVKQLIDILANVVLKTFKNVVDALLEIVQALADWARERFAQDPLYIPIVSDILESFGVPVFTVSDLVCWLGAVPLTIGYKLATAAAPFPDNELTTYLRTAPDFAGVLKRLGTTPQPLMNLAAAKTVQGAKSPRHSASAAFHLISSVAAEVLAVAGTSEALSYQKGEPASSTVTGIISFFGAFDNLCRFIALTIVPRVPFRDPDRRDSAMTVRPMVLSHKLIFGALATVNAIKPIQTVKAWALLGPITDPILVISQLVLTGMHLDEIRQSRSYGNEENLGIVDEVSNLFNYLARASRTALIMDSIDPLDPEVKALIAAFAVGGRFQQGIFQFSEGVAELALDWLA